MVTSLTTLCVTLVMLSPPVVHNSLPREGMTCSNVSCNRAHVTSDNCPLWHFCNSLTGQCRPCGSCRDAEDNAEYHTAALNCRDPLYCVTNYDFLPEHVCPRLRVKEGHQCSGNCLPCEGTLGYFLGTVCRLNCADGDSEVFACVFLNEMAQWNVTRKPLWLEMDNPAHASGPSHSNDVITPDRSVRPGAVYAPPTSSPSGLVVHSNSKFEFSTVVLVSVVISVVVVATVVVGVVVAAVCRRQNRAKCPRATHSAEIVWNQRGLEQRETSMDPASGPNTAPDDNNNSSAEQQQSPRRSKEPVELSYRSVDFLEEDCFTVVHPQEHRNVPTQNSDTHYSTRSAEHPPEKDSRPNSYCFDRPSSGSRISLHSDRGYSPQSPIPHRGRLLVNHYLNKTNQDKADNMWHIIYRPLSVEDETPQKYV